jgi:hypothetical protein
MNLHQLFLTNNACYKAGRTITVKGIMVHSTGANNPTLRRYVGPDDGRLGPNPNNNHWNQATPDGQQKCVHAFIGKLADGSIATYQTLPWNMRGWHAGSGSKGSANDTHIGFEICEDALADPAYLATVYQEAVELCAELCRDFKLDPMAPGVLICHSEGAKLGFASSHETDWRKQRRYLDSYFGSEEFTARSFRSMLEDLYEPDWDEYKEYAKKYPRLFAGINDEKELHRRRVLHYVLQLASVSMQNSYGISRGIRCIINKRLTCGKHVNRG